MHSQYCHPPASPNITLQFLELSQPKTLQSGICCILLLFFTQTNFAQSHSFLDNRNAGWEGQDAVWEGRGDVVLENHSMREAENVGWQTPCAACEEPNLLSTSHCQSAGREYEACELVCSGWYASGELLAWRVARQGLDYAITTDGLADAVGSGTVHNVEFSRDPGFRVGMGYVTEVGWDLGFRYTNFESSQTGSAMAPIAGNLWATRSHPQENEEAQSALAQASLDYQTFDFEVGRWLEINSFTAIHIIGGLRWLNSEQQMLIQYDGNDFNNGVVNDRKSDQAFGIRVGAEGHWKILSGWSAFARGVGGVAFSNSQQQLLETDDAGADLIVDVSDSVMNPLTNLEVSVGLSYSRGSWNLSTGYEMTYWSNLSNQVSYDGVHAGSYDLVSHDLLLEGMFFRVNYTH
ncbi:MAG: hypothetical protein ACI9HK_001972 [Pirellulaceae bacterium]|jgi:hypothetical protein